MACAHGGGAFAANGGVWLRFSLLAASLLPVALPADRQVVYRTALSVLDSVAGHLLECDLEGILTAMQYPRALLSKLKRCQNPYDLCRIAAGFKVTNSMVRALEERFE